MKDLCFLSATQIVEGLQSGDIKSAQVLEGFSNRIAEFEDTVKAWEHYDKDFILQKANEADDYKNIGRPIGPLHGLPIGIKDIFGTNDMPTRCGTNLVGGVHTKDDASVVSFLRNAGALIMGKTVTTEFAYFDPGKTTNPSLMKIEHQVDHQADPLQQLPLSCVRWQSDLKLMDQ